MSSSTRIIDRPAFLIVKLGEWTAARFAERLAPLGLRPRHVAVLYLVGERPKSQFELAQAIGVAPSVVVDMVDELEALGAVLRGYDLLDGRRRSVGLTDRGRSVLAEVDGIARGVDDDLLTGLEPTVRKTLSRSLRHLGRSRGILTSPATASAIEGHASDTRPLAQQPASRLEDQGPVAESARSDR